MVVGEGERLSNSQRPSSISTFRPRPCRHGSARLVSTCHGHPGPAGCWPPEALSLWNRGTRRALGRGLALRTPSPTRPHCNPRDEERGSPPRRSTNRTPTVFHGSTRKSASGGQRPAGLSWGTVPVVQGRSVHPVRRPPMGECTPKLVGPCVSKSPRPAGQSCCLL